MAALEALRRLLRAREGNIATLTALTLPLLLAAAFAVDEGALYLEKRRLQAAVDVAALTAVADPARAGELAAQSFARAGFGPPQEVEIGRYEPERPLGQRFVAGAVPANAARIAHSHAGRVYFARHWFADPLIAASATAHVEPMAAFSLGSRVASLEGGVVNSVLGALWGTQLLLSVLDHRALLALDVPLLPALEILATRLGLTAATYEEVLEAAIALPDLAAALRDAARPGDPGAAVLARLVGLLDPDIVVRLSDILDLGAIGGGAVGEGEATLLVSALDMLTLGALLADGGRQLALDLGATVPGLLGASVQLAVGERMASTGYLALGPAGQVLEIAQLRLHVTAHLRVNAGGPLGILDVRLPLVLELAPARARLAAISCPPDGGATIAAEPGLLGLSIGPGPIVNVLGLVRVTAEARTRSGQVSPVPLTFTQADIASGTIRTAATGTPLESLLGSLLRSLRLDVEILGIPLLGPILALGLEDLLRTTLLALAPALDTLLRGVLSALGLAVGEADVRLNGIFCGSAVLVE